MFQNTSQSFNNSKHPSLFPEPQSSPHQSFVNLTDKSYDDLSRSVLTTHTNYNGPDRNFKVMVRVRPPLPRELASTYFLSTVKVSLDNRKVSVYEYYNIDTVDPAHLTEYAETTNMYTLHAFTFDHVFDQDSTQVQVYETTAKPAVMSVLQGYNATILAYGQTGTGKTFTMEGFKYTNQDPQRGMVPRSMEEIFRYIENVSNSKTTFMVRASYLQIYNEVISDLLRTERTNLHIREDKKRGVFVEGLSEWAVRSPSDIYNLIQKGALARATASTKMNDVSSRSHAVFIIIVEQMSSPEEDDDTEFGKEIRVGKLNLVDLAGSERVRVTGATGKRLEESKKINQSLSALGNVISALTDFKQNRSHIPYRDSKITRLLEDSLGGNCITTMMAMVSPVIEAFGETLSSLKFANRAKNIKNAPIINEDIDQKALVRKYEAELRRLRGELQDRNKFLMDNTSVIQLEEDRKKAERDKVAAVVALEMRSQEFMQEREEKKKLEEKIKSMYSQLLQGGKKVEETPQFRSALEEQQRLIRQQYEKKFEEFEKERQGMEEEKAQVDRYKQLLLKQRDIMIALTTRLNERDETIVQLQEELDAYDRIQRETEDTLEAYATRLEQLEGILMQNQIAFPENNGLSKTIEKPTFHGMARMNKPDMFPTEVIKYDEEDGENSPEQNGINEERWMELNQVMEEQKQEIARLKEQLAEFANYQQDPGYSMKQEMEAMAERIQQVEMEKQNLKEIIIQKHKELVTLQQQDNNFIVERLTGFCYEIKYSLDNIIDSLSSQNEPHKLQDVARELLGLQKLVNSIGIPGDNSQDGRVNQMMNNPANYEEYDRKDLPRQQQQQQYQQQQQQYQQQQQQIQQKAPYYSEKGYPQRPESQGKVRLPEKGSMSNAIDSVKGINPERKPMTVEEMLQLKRKESSKRK